MLGLSYLECGILFIYPEFSSIPVYQCFMEVSSVNYANAGVKFLSLLLLLLLFIIKTKCH